VALQALKDKIGKETSVTVLYNSASDKPPELFGWKYIADNEFYGCEDEVVVMLHIRAKILEHWGRARHQTVVITYQDDEMRPYMAQWEQHGNPSFKEADNCPFIGEESRPKVKIMKIHNSKKILKKSTLERNIIQRWSRQV